MRSSGSGRFFSPRSLWSEDARFDVATNVTPVVQAPPKTARPRDPPLPNSHITSRTCSGRGERIRAGELAPQSLNHLRRFILTAFNYGKRAGRWNGENPASLVKRRRIPRRKPDFLRVHEVPLLLRGLAGKWRPLFATAIYTGLRKGELFALRKSDVDLDTGLILVERSQDNDTTKGGHAESIPIATELIPYLKEAIASSPSELVFPKPDGKMRLPGTRLASRSSSSAWPSGHRSRIRSGLSQEELRLSGIRHDC